LLDGVLAPAGGGNTGTKSGYTFTYAEPVANVGYTINAAPTSVNQTGVNYFYTDASGVIRKNGGAAATVASTPI
jgi:hypothetical protein